MTHFFVKQIALSHQSNSKNFVLQVISLLLLDTDFCKLLYVSVHIAMKRLGVLWVTTILLKGSAPWDSKVIRMKKSRKICPKILSKHCFWTYVEQSFQKYSLRVLLLASLRLKSVQLQVFFQNY